MNSALIILVIVLIALALLAKKDEKKKQKEIHSDNRLSDDELGLAEDDRQGDKYKNLESCIEYIPIRIADIINI